MLTYGKRRKTTLPSFSSLRDSNASSRSKGLGSKNRVSRFPMISNPISSQHNASIDDMAKMLLDDTTTISDPTKSLVIHHDQDKDLPQLPPDDAWAQDTASVVAAAGEMSRSQSFNYVEHSTSQLFNSIHRSTPPPIPRRSSKRKSVLPNTFTAPPAEEGGSQAAIINAKVQAMMAATNALKGNATGKIHLGPFVPAKKRRLQDNKVIVKVRTAINERLNGRSIKKRHDPARDDHLLNSDLNEMQDDEELSQFVSAMDIRLNEGDNLKNPKVASLTGHGYISRKGLADDGRSIRSRKSQTSDPFAERPGSSGITRTPTNFELSLRDDMSIDPSEEFIPDLPTSPPQSSRGSLARGKNPNRSRLAYDVESFDALFSSSPVAQSTPRIRLEPGLEGNGRKFLRHIPAGSRSVFDADASSMVPSLPSEMDIDTPAENPVVEKPSGGRITRKTSIRDIGLFKRYSRKTKKHPSPSKAELEALEKSLKESPVFGTSETFVVSEPSKAKQATPNDAGSTTPSVTKTLAPKDSNSKITAASHLTDKRTILGLFPKPASQPDLSRNFASMSRSGVSMADIKRKGPKSMIPRPADVSTSRPRQELEEPRYSLRDAVLNATDMDIDELQWNHSVYNIGR